MRIKSSLVLLKQIKEILNVSAKDKKVNRYYKAQVENLQEYKITNFRGKTCTQTRVEKIDSKGKERSSGMRR